MLPGFPSLGGASRFAIQRLPSRTTSVIVAPPTNRESDAQTRVQKMPSKSTLSYQIASVQNSIAPVPNRMMTVKTATTRAIRPLGGFGLDDAGRRGRTGGGAPRTPAAGGGGGGGGRAGGRRKVPEADDPIGVAHPEHTEPPLVGTGGRPAHADLQHAVAEAQLLLAQVRRTGRLESLGHEMEDSRAPRRRGPDAPEAQSRRSRQVSAGALGSEEASGSMSSNSGASGAPGWIRPASASSDTSSARRACASASRAASSRRSISRRTSAAGGASVSGGIGAAGATYSPDSQPMSPRDF